jgi:pyruvate/2-oxoglutarate dehydrogenase complex dihydrolipoamide dehydrogenase (E3) component
MPTPAAEVAGLVPEEYDLVILGTGEGAKYLAWTLGKQGKRVASVEQRWIGGSCPNIACLPSKNVIHSAKVASYFARGAEFGIESAGYKVNMAGVIDRKRTMVKALVDIHVRNFQTSGVDLLMGSGSFVGPRLVKVDMNDGTTRLLRGTNVVIGTGTHATVGATPGLVEAKPLTHIELLELEVLPEHLIVIGGGYIGLEFAQAMRRLGSRVSVLERNSGLLHREDQDVSAAMESLFHDEDIAVVLNGTVTGVSGVSGEAVSVTYEQDGARKTISGSHLLVATGRTPNTSNIGLDLAGVALTDSGYIQVNERLQTTAPGTWAIGEVAGSPQFTHIAFDDFRVIRDNLVGKVHVTTGRQVPFTMFTDPELAKIGLGENEAKAKGISYRVFKIPMAADLRTRTLSETRGFMKALVAADDSILGFTIFGVDGGEIMAMVQIAMIGGLPYTALREAILTHPTLAEGLMVLFSSAPTAVLAQ